MGWFSNKMTINRLSNSVGMAAVMISLQESKDTLTAANEFVATQKQRASGLSARAFAVQGASSSTGQSLQRAINDLSSYQADGREVGLDLNDRMNTLALVIEQFALPRGQRSLNMSGADMTGAVMDGAVEVVANLNILKNSHLNKVSDAVTCIDNADRELNGSSSTSARALMPSFT